MSHRSRFHVPPWIFLVLMLPSGAAGLYLADKVLHGNSSWALLYDGTGVNLWVYSGISLLALLAFVLCGMCASALLRRSMPPKPAGSSKPSP
jgi:hypothetical protein